MSEFGGKEIVNLLTGERLGLVGESDLVIDEQTGRIDQMVLPARRGLFGARPAYEVPWSAVRRIGPEVVIVELEQSSGSGPGAWFGPRAGAERA